MKTASARGRSFVMSTKTWHHEVDEPGWQDSDLVVRRLLPLHVLDVVLDMLARPWSRATSAPSRAAARATYGWSSGYPIIHVEILSGPLLLAGISKPMNE